MLKGLIKKTPVIRDLARIVLRATAERGQREFKSGSYWEERYRSRGNSGAGSYNRLAHFKADTLNAFVAEHDVQSVIEFGSGDGAQLRLARYPSYIGVDVSRSAIAFTQDAFAQDASKRFVHTDDLTSVDRADLALSLDVIYHLIEDSVFETYMGTLFEASRKYVIVYSSNSDRRTDAVHVKHRIFTQWVEANRPEFRLVRTLANPYPEDIRDLDNTSFADFFFFEKTSQG